MNKSRASRPLLAMFVAAVVGSYFAIPTAMVHATPTPTLTPTPTTTSTPVAGTKLYGVEGTTVYEIDPDAQTIVPLAPALPFTGLTIATMDPGEIYVSTFDNNTIEYQLHRYRPGIGTTLLGSLEAGLIGLGEGRDGFLYGGEAGVLYRIDPLDTPVVLVGIQFGVAPLAGDMAADLAGTLFGIRDDGILYTVDKDNGAQTEVGPSLSFWGLSFTRDGRLWGSRASNGNLYQIDPTTGAATFVMATVPNMSDLASQLGCGDGLILGDETCDDENLAEGDGCSAACLADPCYSCTGMPSVCTPLPDATPCDDGSMCTTNNQCLSTVCVGDEMPAVGCRAPFVPGKAQLLIKDKSPNKRDRLAWKWLKGEATAIGDFGTPLTTTSYELCIYNATPSVIGNYHVPAGGMCAGKPCWKADTKKAKYNDKELTPDGVQKLQLKPSAVNGKAKALLKGKRGRLVLPALPIPIVTLPLTVQLKNSDGECWTATYSTFKKNQSDQFKAKAD